MDGRFRGHEKSGAFGIANLEPETVRKAIENTETGFHVSTMTMSLYAENND